MNSFDSTYKSNGNNIYYYFIWYICDFFLFHIEIVGTECRWIIWGGGGGGGKGYVESFFFFFGGGGAPPPPLFLRLCRGGFLILRQIVYSDFSVSVLRSFCVWSMSGSSFCCGLLKCFVAHAVEEGLEY